MKTFMKKFFILIGLDKCSSGNTIQKRFNAGSYMREKRGGGGVFIQLTLKIQASQQLNFRSDSLIHPTMS